MAFRLEYTAEPTLRAFHASDAFIRGVRGPVGSGKSTGVGVMEMLIRAHQQEPGAGKRRKTRWAAVRNTYGELKSTTIRTWQEWVPQDLAPIKWDEPITCKMVQPLDDGTILDLEIIFIAVDRPAHIKKLKSLELTGAWLNEASELDKSVLDMLTARVGRCPSKKDGKMTWCGVVMDTNSMDDDHWYHDLAEGPTDNEKRAELEEMLEGLRHSLAQIGMKRPLLAFFDQPAALIEAQGSYIPNPEAENIRNLNLGSGYYLQLVAGKSKDWIDMYVMNRYGKVIDGKPVYPEYNEQIHGRNINLRPIPGLPIMIGLDFGLSPAAVAMQVSTKGQLLVLGECVSLERSMGLRQFIGDALKPYLANRFGNVDSTGGTWEFRLVGDPAGAQRAQGDEKTAFQIANEMNWSITPAKTNAFMARRESIAWFLNRLVEGQPAFLLDATCKMLRKGFRGGYHYRRVQVVGEARFQDIPYKNKYCVDTETEALTPCGWKRFDKLNVGDDIMVVSDDNLLHVDKVLAVNVFDGVHQAIRMCSSQADFIFTEDHRHFVQNRHGKQFIRKTVDLSTDMNFIAPPMEKRARKDVKLSDRFVRIAAWVAAEGSYRRNDQAIMLAQSKTANPEYTAYLRYLLANDQCVVAHDTNSDMQTWRITKELAWAIRRFMPNKAPSPEFIMMMNNQQRRLFLYEFMRGDGNCSNGKTATLMPDKQKIAHPKDFHVTGQSHRIFQKSKESADALQMIGSLCGLPISLSESKNGWVANIRQQPSINVGHLKRSKVTVDGVWCPTTATGNWIMRRKGRVIVTGNSHPVEACQYGALEYVAVESPAYGFKSVPDWQRKLMANSGHSDPWKRRGGRV